MIDADYVSPDGALRFIVRSPAGDVTMGFDAGTWHIHGDILAAHTAGTSVASFWSSRAPEAAAESVAEHTKRYVESLLGNRLIIAVLKGKGMIRDIWITDDPAEDMRRRLAEETIEFRLWDGTEIVAGSDR